MEISFKAFVESHKLTEGVLNAAFGTYGYFLEGEHQFTLDIGDNNEWCETDKDARFGVSANNEFEKMLKYFGCTMTPSAEEIWDDFHNKDAYQDGGVAQIVGKSYSYQLPFFVGDLKGRNGVTTSVWVDLDELEEIEGERTIDNSMKAFVESEEHTQGRLNEAFQSYGYHLKENERFLLDIGDNENWFESEEDGKIAISVDDEFEKMLNHFGSTMTPSADEIWDAFDENKDLHGDGVVQIVSESCNYRLPFFIGNLKGKDGATTSIWVDLNELEELEVSESK